MSGVCLGVAFTLVTVSIPADSFTLSWTHSVEKTRWEEDYVVRDARLILTAARVQGAGAGMEPGGVRRGAFWEYRPKLPPLQSITLANSAYAADYQLCAAGVCRPLHAWLGGDGRDRPVDLFPCNARGRGTE